MRVVESQSGIEMYLSRMELGALKSNAVYRVTAVSYGNGAAQDASSEYHFVVDDSLTEMEFDVSNGINFVKLNRMHLNYIKQGITPVINDNGRRISLSGSSSTNLLKPQ